MGAPTGNIRGWWNLPYRLCHLRTIELRYNGLCGLIGVDGRLRIYAEESYGDGWHAQYIISMDGDFIAVADQESGANPDIEPLPRSSDLKTPRPAWASMHLNYGGAPHRGEYARDDIARLARPLSYGEKEKLIGLGYFPDMPFHLILGVVESYVLSETTVDADLFLICRRLRIAYLLQEPVTGPEGSRYDYDTHVLHLAQWFDQSKPEMPLEYTLLDEESAGISMNSPTEGVFRDGYLFLADSGMGRDGLVSCIHIWEVIPESDGDEWDEAL